MGDFPLQLVGKARFPRRFSHPQSEIVGQHPQVQEMCQGIATAGGFAWGVSVDLGKSMSLVGGFVGIFYRGYSGF